MLFLNDTFLLVSNLLPIVLQQTGYNFISETSAAFNNLLCIFILFYKIIPLLAYQLYKIKL